MDRPTYRKSLRLTASARAAPGEVQRLPLQHIARKQPVSIRPPSATQLDAHGGHLFLEHRRSQKRTSLWFDD